MEKLNRDELIDWVKAQVDFQLNDTAMDELEPMINRLWWTAFNQGATVERVNHELEHHGIEPIEHPNFKG